MTLSPHLLLSARDATEIDRVTIAFGTPGFTLMQRAGAAIAAVIAELYDTPVPCLALCGPGRNGGDGFIAAEMLRRAGWPVRAAMISAPEDLRGDAALALAFYQGEVLPWSPELLDGTELILDALFGVGLNRPLAADFALAVEAVNRRKIPVIAVDLPSGIHADSGMMMGAAIEAQLTITFTARKSGLLLLPGRTAAGQVIVRDIGMDPGALAVWAETAQLTENHPDLWREALPRFHPGQHKYDHGHALVLGGATMTGAARLAARSAQRVGTGLVTVAAPPEAVPVYATNLDSALVRALVSESDWRQAAQEKRVTALLLGPGAGTGAATRSAVLEALATRKPCVLDADALTVFADMPEALFAALHGQCVLTPHTGEFARLFGSVGEAGKLAAARDAARRSGAVIVLKEADTVIAGPDGRAAINANAPAWLATAGSGDVLAGAIAGLLAQGMEAFAAACAGVWLHGAAAHGFAPGMIAEDLTAALPKALVVAHKK